MFIFLLWLCAVCVLRGPRPNDSANGAHIKPQTRAYFGRVPTLEYG
jgi:hypothetical protein